MMILQSMAFKPLILIDDDAFLLAQTKLESNYRAKAPYHHQLQKLGKLGFEALHLPRAKAPNHHQFHKLGFDSPSVP
jgi:hypothetical protein